MPALVDTVKVVSQPESTSFSTEKKGWYFLSISARVKDKKQRSGNQTDDEELTIKVDGLAFPKNETQEGLLNSPASFSGGTQHNEEKTIFFIIELFAGQHSLVLSPQHEATITKIEYDLLQITDGQVVLNLNRQPQDLQSSPWLTFVLIGGNFTQVAITAKIWWRWKDGDDLQVRISRKIIPNPSPVFNKNWIFRSRPVLDILGRNQTKLFTLPSENYLQYIELWADRSPLLETVKFIADQTKPWPQWYTTSGENTDYNRFDREIAEKTAYWNAHFFGQQHPPKEHLDPSLVKAMMYVESRIGYYSAPVGFYQGYPDVMQIGDERNPAIHTLNNDGWVSPATNKVARENEWTNSGPQIMDYKNSANTQTPADSIHWAILWLFHKAEVIETDGSRSWRLWEEAVSRYNGGGDKEYQKKVYEIYNYGPQKNQ